MKIILTPFQEKFIEVPTRRQRLSEINKRNGLRNHQELRDELFRLEKGAEGEQILLKYLEEFGQPHWRALTNVRLDYYGECECDLLLLTRAGILPCEVKNYTGKFELTNNQCTIRGDLMDGNPIAQAQRLTSKMKKMFADLPSVSCNQGTLAFVGADNKVVINDQVDSIKIVDRSGLRDYIRNIGFYERSNHGNQLDVDLILARLGEFESESSFVADELPGETAAFIDKGICCYQCGSFALDFGRKYFTCGCGMHEDFELAILRTICEYAIIFQKDSYTSKEITDFFDDKVSYYTIYRLVNKHFTKNGSNRHTTYIIDCFYYKKLKKSIKDHRYIYFDL